MRGLGWLVAAVVVAFVGAKLAGPLRELRGQPMPDHPQWGVLALSGALFLLAHGVLVQTWRSVLSCWDARLPFWAAARVWSVSNLARYLPAGWLVQVGAMGAMARKLGVSAVAAPGAAILSTIVNVLAGFVVALVAGRTLLDQTRAGGSRMAALVLVVAALSLAAAPLVVPRLARIAARVTRRPIAATLPARAVLYALAGNLIAWLLYGLAFQLFTQSVLGRADGAYQGYLAVYTVAYLAGYLSFVPAAGIGVREGAMVVLLTVAGLTSHPEAAYVAVTSRLWLTLLEVVPGFLFWAHAAARGRSPTTDPSDVPT